MKISENKLRSIIRSVIRESYEGNYMDIEPDDLDNHGEVEDPAVTAAYEDHDYPDDHGMDIEPEDRMNYGDYSNDILDMCKDLCSNSDYVGNEEIAIELQQHYGENIDRMHIKKAIETCTDELTSSSDKQTRALCSKCISVLSELLS